MSNNYHLWLKFLLAKLPTFHSPKTKDNFFLRFLSLYSRFQYISLSSHNPHPKSWLSNFFQLGEKPHFSIQMRRQ